MPNNNPEQLQNPNGYGNNPWDSLADDHFRGQTDINRATGKKRTYTNMDLYPREKGESNEEYGARLKNISEQEKQYLAAKAKEEAAAKAAAEAQAYRESELGQEELGIEVDFDRLTEKLDQAVRDGRMSAEHAAALKEQQLNRSVAAIDAARESYADRKAMYDADLVDSTEVFSREEVMKARGEKTMNAAEVNPTAGPVTEPEIINSEPQPTTEAQPAQQPEPVKEEPRPTEEAEPAQNSEAKSAQENETLDIVDAKIAEQYRDRLKEIEEWKQKDQARENPVFTAEEYAALEQAAAIITYAQQKMANREKQEVEAAKAAETEAAKAAEVEAAKAAEIAAAKAAEINAAKDNTAEAEKSRIERIKERIEKAKQKPGFRKFVAGAVSLALAAALATGGVIGNFVAASQSDQSQDPPIEQEGEYGSYDEYHAATSGDQSGENQESHHGIKDGYYETGEFMSANKATPYDFANAAEVASVVGQDECDVMKEVDRNQVESLADHLANIPDAVKAKYGVSQEFMGLSILDTEAKLQSLSDEDYDKLIKQVDQIWDAAFTESVTLNGEYQNAYMRLIDPSQPATHDNVELVECTTYENGTQATNFFWTIDENGNSDRIGSAVFKISHDADGNIAVQCTQGVNQIGSNTHLYGGMPTITPTPDNPGTPDNPPTPPDNPPDNPPDDPPTPPDNPPDDPPTPPDDDRGKGDDTHAGEDQQPMGPTENTVGDPEREATDDNNASNADPGSEVTNDTIEQEYGVPDAAPGSEAIADNQGVTVDGAPLTDPTSGEQVVREGEGGEATDQEIADAAEGVASTFDAEETNADHPDAVVADNANTVEQNTVDTSDQRGAGQNVERSQEDLANIVNGGGR